MTMTEQDKLRSKLHKLIEHARAETAVWSNSLERLPTSDYARVMPEGCRILAQLAATCEGCRLLAQQIFTVPGVDAVAIAYAAGAVNNLKRIQARRLYLFGKDE